MLPPGFLNLLTTLSGILLPPVDIQDKAADKCLIILDTDCPIFAHENFTVLRIGQNYVNPGAHQLIKQSVWCAIGIVFSEEKFEFMANFLKPTDRHFIIAYTKENPVVKSESIITRTILWAKTTQLRHKRSLHVKRWCPTVGKVKNKGLHKYMTCLEKAERCHYLANVPKECPSPLWRQKLTLANVQAPMYSLPTELTGKPVAGLHVRAFQLLARKNQAQVEIVTQEQGVGIIIIQNMTFSPGIFNDVINKRVEFGISGGYGIVTNILMDLPAFLGSNEARFASRIPRPKMTLQNLLRPFPFDVWIMFILSLLSISIYLKVAYCAYNAIPTRKHLMIKQEDNWLNFLIFPFCKITEPEPLPWFKTWSGGKLGVALWMLLSFYMVSFYSMNLRAYLIMPEYEKQIDTLQDVLDNDGRVWIYRSQLSLSKPFLESIGMQNSIIYKIADKAEMTGGLWTVRKSSTGIGIDPRISKDVSENGATFLTDPITIRYLYKTGDPYLQRHKLYLGKEPASYWYNCLAVAKNSPATKYVSQVSRVIFESGLTLKYETDHLPGTALFNVKPTQDSLTPLVLGHFSSAFILYFAFLLASLLAFLVETRAFKKVKLSAHHSIR